jgi:hypothetical protein
MRPSPRSNSTTPRSTTSEIVSSRRAASAPAADRAVP